MVAHGAAGSGLLMAAAFLVAASFLISSSVVTATALARADDAWESAGVSWALGVVLPNGAELVNGNHLSWAEVGSVTVLVKLPSITEPVGVTYLVLSAEGDNGAVLQVAAGIWPGCDDWSAYSWYITGTGTSDPSYTWVMNSSSPSMVSGDLISMSVFAGANAWGIRVQNLNSSETKTGSVASGGLTGFASGDQEVFALESYTTSASTFREMGNATLLAVLVDGSKVAGGWYAYGGWDPAHNPLFVVGDSQPPTYVSLKMAGNGEVFWSYGSRWTGGVLTASFQPVVIAYASLAALVPMALVVGSRTKRGREARK
jgi:hypothetical protein